MPLYLFQALQPPGVTIKRLERLYNSFLWGSKGDTRRIHWAKWEKVCGTEEEGGLGFRLLKDMVHTFTKKQWWRFRTQDNMWSKFLESKYWRGRSIIRGEGKKNDSYGWKKMCKVQKEAEDRMTWAVGQGKMLVWCDKWLKGGTLEELYTEGIRSRAKVESIMRDGSWNTPLIQIMFPNQISSQILETPIVQEDCAFWGGGDANVFSTKQVWNQTRERREVKSIYGMLWHSNIPTKISMFIWRLLQDLIPSEMRMKRFGVALASRCMCCQEEETTNHAFIWSATAQAVWKYFGRITNVQHKRFSSVEDLLKCWFYSHDWVEKGHVRTWIPMVTLWGIWKARNAAKHHNTLMTEKNIIAVVENKLQNMVTANKISMSTIAGETTFMEKFGIKSVRKKKRKICVITWKKPETDWIKINIDGCSRGNPGLSGAGGIARDFRGVPVCSFFSALGFRSAFAAELEALRLGLRMCREKNFRQIWIESDSQALCKLVNEGKVGSWTTFEGIAEVRKILVGCTWRMTHIGREGNSPADFLANLGLETGSTACVPGIPASRWLEGAITSEINGWPYVRRRYKS